MLQNPSPYAARPVFALDFANPAQPGEIIVMASTRPGKVPDGFSKAVDRPDLMVCLKMAGVEPVSYSALFDQNPSALVFAVPGCSGSWQVGDVGLCTSNFTASAPGLYPSNGGTLLTIAASDRIVTTASPHSNRGSGTVAVFDRLVTPGFTGPQTITFNNRSNTVAVQLMLHVFSVPNDNSP